MKFRIIENIEDSTPRETATLDLLLTPLEGNTVEDVILALGNRDYYGEYLINTRNKKEVEQAIIKHFGPNLPTHKRPLEKKQGFKFPPKTREAMENLIKSFEGKPNLITYEPYRDNQILIPTEKNNSQITTTNILKTVLGNAGIKYKLEKFENLREHRQVSRMKELAGLKEIKVNRPFPIKFEDLEENKQYEFTYKLDYLDNGAEKTDVLNLWIIDNSEVDGSGTNFLIVTHPGDAMEDSFELYPEDIISIRSV